MKKLRWGSPDLRLHCNRQNGMHVRLKMLAELAASTYWHVNNGIGNGQSSTGVTTRRICAQAAKLFRHVVVIWASCFQVFTCRSSCEPSLNPSHKAACKKPDTPKTPVETQQHCCKQESHRSPRKLGLRMVARSFLCNDEASHHGKSLLAPRRFCSLKTCTRGSRVFVVYACSVVQA